jgi:hypothetical protein
VTDANGRDQIAFTKGNFRRGWRPRLHHGHRMGKRLRRQPVTGMAGDVSVIRRRE